MAKRSNDISFIRTPVEFLRLGITSAAELVIVSLAFAFKDKGLRMSNNQLAELLSTDRRHIPRLVHRLIGKGLLESAIENGCRILRFTDTKVVSPPDTKVVSPPDTKVVTRGHQSGVKVTPNLPCPSITEVTEVTELGAQQPSPSEAGGGKRKPKAKTTNRQKASPDVEAVFEHWNLHRGRSIEKQGQTVRWKGHERKPDGSLAPDIVTAIRRCLDAGYSPDEIEAAVDNYATVLLEPEYYWSYTWPLATFLTVADGRGKAGIPKWTKFLPNNFIQETYLAKRFTSGPAEPSIAELAGCEPADEEDARRLYQEAGLIEG